MTKFRATANNTMRTLRLIVTSALILVGLLVFLEDVDALVRWGCDVNDVFAIDPRSGPIDWPTGERPTWTYVPAFVYSVGFWLIALLSFVPWPVTGKADRGRVIRGTE